MSILLSRKGGGSGGGGAPSGPAGGVLGGTYPDPSFAAGAALPFVGVRALRSTNQLIGPGAFTAVQLNAADTFDTDGFHDPSSSNTRLTVPTGKGGYYQIEGQVQYEVNTTGARSLTIELNGLGTILAQVLNSPATGFGTIIQVGGPWNLSAGDYVELKAFQSTAGDLNVNSAWFAAYRLGT